MRVYTTGFRDGGVGRGNNQTFAFGGRILVPAAVFLAFWEDFCRVFFYVFLLLKLQRAQKCNKKSIFFSLFRGSGAKLSFKLKNNTWGKIFGRLAFNTWVGGNDKILNL